MRTLATITAAATTFSHPAIGAEPETFEVEGDPTAQAELAKAPEMIPLTVGDGNIFRRPIAARACRQALGIEISSE